MSQELKIVLDAGHGEGKTHNRGGVLFNEGDQNYYFSVELKKQLEMYQGISVELTRKTIKSNPSLLARARMGNGADLFISNHTNAYGDRNVRGVEAFLSVRNNSTTLAKSLVGNASKLLKTPNRGVKRNILNNGKDYFGVLRDTNAKYALLIEWVFHTNREDSRVYLDKQVELAKLVAKIIAEHYNRKLKTTNPTHEVIGAVNIRPEPSTNKASVGHFKTGDKIEVESINGNWAKLKEKDRYVSVKYIKSLKPKTEKFYRVMLGAFEDRKNAETLIDNATKKGLNPYLVYEEVKR